jgi:signal transduction histidine kinase
MNHSIEHPAPGATRVHIIVRVDWVVRVTTFPLYLLLYGTHLGPRGASRWVWALFIWYLLIWPHIARFLATRSSDSKSAELRNLLIDSFFIGTAVPLTWFSLWPNAAGFLGIHAGNVLNGGVRQGAKGILLFILGVVLMTLAVGVHFEPLGASLLTQALSFAVVAAFTTVFTGYTWRQSRDVIQRGRQIRAQAAQIEEKGTLLEQRSVELEAALHAAEAANAAKGNFLANMSHELRTPLNSIIGFGNILKKNSAGALGPRELSYLERITANGAHLLMLINGVLDLSKIDAQQMQLDMTEVDVSALLRETIAELEPQAEARGIKLVADIPPMSPLLTDRSRLKQIVLNLVGNAIKFTHEGRVTVRAFAHPNTHLPVRIDVVDTGIGIAPERMEAIFHPFQQEDTTTTRRYGGTGLGLTITRSLAHLMGWEIQVQSDVGVGSTFSVLMQQAPGGPPAFSDEFAVSRDDSGRAA